MPNNHLVYLSRANFVSSMETIKDARTLKFANMSLEWWDKEFGWYTKGCIALTNEENIHLCYIFFKIDRNNEYITIHNIFTQTSMRRNGYAHELLKMVFDFALTLHVRRFKFTSISNSLDFYLSLGFVYWGVNSVGDYYCDLPMPLDGLNGVEFMTDTFDITALLGKRYKKILTKVSNNEINLSEAQTLIYNSDLLKMRNCYMLKELLDHTTVTEISKEDNIIINDSLQNCFDSSDVMEI
ncbi:GNAT family N-acetyltransferase [bacterium]|nr:GNAT family N-acetyltransferase [bacterium]MBU1883698.1 GNAT family N-acetyltransferase [bacterium]